eukprot:6458984-Amphidinium_carterae.1
MPEDTDGKLAAEQPSDAGENCRSRSRSRPRNGEKESSPKEITAVQLLCAAKELAEKHKEDKNLNEAATLLEGAAAKIGSLEKTVGELNQSLQAVGSMTGQILRGLGASLTTMEFDNEMLVSQTSVPKSFLVKTGDEPAQQESSDKKGTRTLSSGGVLSAEAQSRDQMEQARQARIARLQAQQESRSKELQDAAVKDRAHGAMFKS